VQAARFVETEQLAFATRLMTAVGVRVIRDWKFAAVVKEP
jgi:hypothetical protein